MLASDTVALQARQRANELMRQAEERSRDSQSLYSQSQTTVWTGL